MNDPETRLKELGLTLPIPANPMANYAPWTRSGSLVFISGQIPLIDGTPLFQGEIGSTVSMEQAVLAARQCALNIIAHIKSACAGDLSRVKGVLKLNAFLNTPSQFADHPKIVNGASDLMVAVFGDKGRHARSSVGCSSLPLNCPIEIDAIIEIEG